MSDFLDDWIGAGAPIPNSEGLEGPLEAAEIPITINREENYRVPSPSGLVMRVEAVKPALRFYDDARECGKLEWTTEGFKFYGAADESAKQLFNFLKPHVDAYLENKNGHPEKHDQESKTKSEEEPPWHLCESGEGRTSKTLAFCEKPSCGGAHCGCYTPK